jgi:phosphoglycerol transferase MdoB-like AlkP superfamily enzyme
MLFPILSLLIGTSVNRTVARTKRNGIFVAIAILFVLTAYALAVVAGAIWLAGIYGPIGAALFLAACALLIAIIVVIVMMVINAQEARRAAERRQALESLAAAGIGLVRAQPLLTAGIIAALVASNLMGSKSRD